MVLQINEEDVKRLVNINDAIYAVEAVGKSIAAGKTVQIPRARLRMSNGFLHLMPASLEEEGYFGYKAYTSFHGKARFFVHLFDSRNGELRAIIDADKLGQLRTGAASGIATRVLAKKTPGSLGIIGSGYQAESQLTAALAVHKFTSIRIFSRNFDHAADFCKRMSVETKVDLQPVMKIEDAGSCDVVTTTTSAASPVLFKEMLKSGCHINAVGGNTLIKRELDEHVVDAADTIVIDNIEQGKLECGDFIPSLEKGRLHWGDVLEFGDLFNGRAARKSDTEITLFKSQGIAPWDVALAKVIFERALQQNIGTRLQL